MGDTDYIFEYKFTEALLDEYTLVSSGKTNFLFACKNACTIQVAPELSG